MRCLDRPLRSALVLNSLLPELPLLLLCCWCCIAHEATSCAASLPDTEIGTRVTVSDSKTVKQRLREAQSETGTQ